VVVRVPTASERRRGSEVAWGVVELGVSVMGASVVLVEGGWSTGAVYDALIAELDGRGVDAVASNLVNAETGARMAFASPRCTARLREVIDAATGAVVLAAHSGGGFDITEVGDHPKVAHMVFMSAFMPGSGVDISEAMSRVRDATDNDGDLNYYRPDRAREVFFEDLPPERIETAVAAMVPTERMVSVPDPVDPSWRHRPTTYVVFDADQALPRDVQLGSGALTDEVVHIEGASHFGFMSQPERVADVLAGIATSIS
jgi:pimeloyl-ACP methyl ester carboxylesterase